MISPAFSRELICPFEMNGSCEFVYSHKAPQNSCLYRPSAAPSYLISLTHSIQQADAFPAIVLHFGGGHQLEKIQCCSPCTPGWYYRNSCSHALKAVAKASS